MAAPTDYAQYMLELVNNARLDPESEADRLGIDLNQGVGGTQLSGAPKQPLAFQGDLIEAALGHSSWMLNTGNFSHTGAGGSSPGFRMDAAGYEFTGAWSWGENIALRGTTGPLDLQTFWDSAHDGLFRSPGHRLNILNDYFREVGIGGANGPSDGFNKLLVTQNFAKSGSDWFVTGVAYNDQDGDGAYSVGEGQGNVQVNLAGAGAVPTYASGGYAVAVDPGNYMVTFSGGGLAAPVKQEVEVGNANPKLDLVDGGTIRTSTSLTLDTSADNLVLLGAGDLTGVGNKRDNRIDGGSGDNLIRGKAGADEIAGNRGDDTLKGGSGRDDLSGADGNDRLGGGSSGDMLEGGAGRDRLQGGGGADRLYGNAGNDTLEGGRGKDTLEGGSGNDVFKFAPGWSVDTVSDFNPDFDKIDLRPFDIAQFSDLTIANPGGDTRIDFGNGDRILLAGVAPNEIDMDDFLL